MGAVSVEIQLQSIDDYIIRKHGFVRALTFSENMVLVEFSQLIQQAIRDRWPVDTGTSRDRWQVTSAASFGALSILIENPMFYAEFVHNGLWERLIPAVWDAVKNEFSRAMKFEIDRTERRLEGATGEGLINLIRALA